MKLLLLEDRPAIRSILVEEFSQIAGVHHIYPCAEPGMAVQIARENKPQVAVLDIHVPPNGALRSGIDVLRIIKAECPDTVVIMLTAFGSFAHESACRQLGAEFFFDKTEGLDRVIEAIRPIAHGFRRDGAPIRVYSSESQTATK